MILNSGSNKINLILRFLLELTALFALGLWGWEQEESWLRYFLAFGTPIAAAAIWGIFNVPDDPSRSGKAPVRVPGLVRLMIELVIFAGAALALSNLNNKAYFMIMVSLVIIHYLFSIDRIKWLLRTK